MEAGQYLGAFACYGYMKNPQDKHKLIIDEEAARIVQEMFSLYLEGNGVHRIALILTERRVPTPSQFKKQKGINFSSPNRLYTEKYGAWSPNTVKRILRNETYIGTLIQGRERKVSYKSKKVVVAPKDEWVVIKNNHDPIVSEDQFYKVQRLIDRKRTGYGYEPGKDIGRMKPHLLAGKFRCADCDSTMQRSGLSRNGKTHFLRCRLSSVTKRRDCTPHCIMQEKVGKMVIQKIQELINGVATDGELIDIINAALQQLDRTNSMRPKLEKQPFEAEAKIDAISKNIAMAYADKLNCLISENDFLSFRAIFEQEKQACVKRKEYLSGELAAMDIRQKSYGNINALIEKYKKIDVLTHEIINDFVDTILIGEKDPVTKEQVVTINWLF